MKNINGILEVMIMGTMGNDSGAQSNNKSFEEIYRQLDELEMDPGFSET